jgi:hypothetical protein
MRKVQEISGIPNPPFWINAIPPFRDVWYSPYFHAKYKYFYVQPIIGDAPASIVGFSISFLMNYQLLWTNSRYSAPNILDQFTISLVFVGLIIFVFLFRFIGIIRLRIPLDFHSLSLFKGEDPILLVPLTDTELFHSIALSRLLAAYKIISETLMVIAGFSASFVLLAMARAVLKPDLMDVIGSYIFYDYIIGIPTAVVLVLVFILNASIISGSMALRNPVYICGFLGVVGALFGIFLVILASLYFTLIVSWIADTFLRLNFFDYVNTATWGVFMVFFASALTYANLRLGTRRLSGLRRPGRYRAS